MLSADANEEARQEALAAGADLYMSKPVKFETLIEAVTMITQAKPQAANVTSIKSAGSADAAQGPVLNMETVKGLIQLGPDDDLLEKLMHTFVDDSRELLESMREAATQKRYEEVRTGAHAMKGSAGSLGLDRLMMLCARVQRMKEPEMRQQLANVMRDVEREFEHACEALTEYLATRRSAPRADPQARQ